MTDKEYELRSLMNFAIDMHVWQARDLAWDNLCLVAERMTDEEEPKERRNEDGKAGE